MIVNRTFAGFLALMACVLAVGCKSPTSYNIQVRLDESLKDPQTNLYPALEVDVVGAGGAIAQTLNSKSVTAYFDPNDQYRSSLGMDRLTLKFDNARSDPQTVKATDEIWTRWLEQKQATSLFVLVNLPGRFTDAEGNADPRRLILPLARNRWSTDTIEVVIRKGAVMSVQEPKPE